MKSDDELVFETLWTGRVRKTVCLPVREIASVCGLEPSVVRASMRRLCESGRLRFTGRRFRNTAIFEFPSGAAAAGGGEGSPLRDIPSHTHPATDRQAHSAAPTVVSPDDEEELSDEEWQRRREHGLQRVDELLDRLEVAIGPPDLEAGLCGECGEEVRRRWTLGKFQLCRTCRTRRAAVAAKLTAEKPLPPPAPVLANALVEQAARRRNGHHADDDTDDLLPEVEW